jgi:RNA polymerase sigma-70 factor, ECF subfamily
MHTTPVSLLQRLGSSPTPAAWERFIRLYTPLLFYWARRRGLQEHDAADLVHDVLVVLVQKLPEFQYRPGKSFRGWMRMVLLNKWRDRKGEAAPAAGFAGWDAGASGRAHWGGGVDVADSDQPG